jgi:ribosomal protein S18 acetylase RimI-like enzyme
VVVRPLRADEAPLYQTLRLRALADAPDAFARTFAETRAQPQAWWDEMTRAVTEPGRHVMFVAEAPAPVGMAFGLIDVEQAGRAHLGGMWVDPSARRHGVGRALADAVMAWARGRAFVDVVLWVTEGNDPARTLYERMGFAATGRRDRLPSNPTLEIVEMRCVLSAVA